VRVSGLDDQKMSEIASGLASNYFLAESGELFISDKTAPSQVRSANLSLKFIAIAAADYFMGIAANGRLYIWGAYND
jgi:hypothetical protein